MFSPHIKIKSLHEKLKLTLDFFKGEDACSKFEDSDRFFVGEKEHSVEWLDDIWLYFPVPFKKGDIVINCLQADKEHYKNCYMDIFVFDKATDNLRKRADCSDMNGYGYFQLEDGAVYYESMWTYMDIEYYRGELTGQGKLLYALSNYLKGEFGENPALLLASQRALMMRNYRDDWNEDFLNFYTEKALRIAGLK